MPRVLVVDDEDVVRDVLSKMIEAIGPFETDTASDGIEALDRLKEGHYDIVFTDLRMPRLGGFEFMKEAREISPTVPFVVVTALSHLDTAINALRDGASDFITKPFKYDDIRRVLDRVNRERSILKSLDDNGNRDGAVRLLNSELFRKLNEINLLFTLSSELDEITDNSEILQKLPSMIAKLLRANCVILRAIENDYLISRSCFGQSIVEPIRLQGSIFEKVFNDGKYMLLELGELSPLDRTPLNSEMLIVPIMLHEEVFGFIVITDKIDGYRFSEDVINLVLTLIHKASLRLENNALYEITYNNLLNTLKTLVLTIEARDSYTKQHSENVTDIALEIAEVVECTQEEKDALKFGGYLHDIGKIGVRDTILLKPARLTSEEYEEIKKHPLIGDTIVAPLGSLPLERLLIRHHHERFDGKGYPDGLAGEEIPLIARILAVADTYDSMTTNRPYRKGLSHQIAIDEIKRCSGTQFDPAIARAFLNTPTARRGLNHDKA